MVPDMVAGRDYERSVEDFAVILRSIPVACTPVSGVVDYCNVYPPARTANVRRIPPPTLF
jgi:hypothetical protein